LLAGNLLLHDGDLKGRYQMAYGHVSSFLLRILVKGKYFAHIHDRPQYLSPIMTLIVMTFVFVFFILPSQTKDNIVQSNIAVGLRHSIAIKSNKAVVSIGDNRFGQCNVKSWTDIVQVVAGWYHTVGKHQSIVL
jgi:alpha-tubulin suppressor-like RCC1 family protein